MGPEGALGVRDKKGGDSMGSYCNTSIGIRAMMFVCIGALMMVGLTDCKGGVPRNQGVPPAGEYDPQVLARYTGTGDPGKPCTVWLKDLKREALRHGAESGRPGAPLTLGGLTDIRGYRWSDKRKDVEILGVKVMGYVPPILLDQFVQALRVAPEGLIWMSLDPGDKEDLSSPYRVDGYPKEIINSRWAEPLIRADYFVKAMSLDLVPSVVEGMCARNKERDLTDKSLKGTVRDQVLHNNLSFIPDSRKTRIVHAETADGFEVLFEQMPIVIQTGRDSVPEVNSFARDMNDNFDKLKAQYPGVFLPLHSMFKLYSLGSCLLRERAFVPVELDYWLSDYPLAPYDTPDELPGFKEFCN